MSGYIEKDREGSFFNPISSTVEINPDDKSATEENITDDEMNAYRWEWLTKKWDTMEFADKMALFYPSNHIIDLKDTSSSLFDDYINMELCSVAFDNCRAVKDIKFELDRQGIPHILVIYDKINVDAIPDSTIREKVRAWGIKYGFISY